MADIGSIEELLLWIITQGGSIIIVAWVLAWLFDDVSGWHTLKAKWKKIIILGISLLMGAGAVWLNGRPDLVQLIKPYADMAIISSGVWLVTQIAHKADK